MSEQNPNDPQPEQLPQGGGPFGEALSGVKALNLGHFLVAAGDPACPFPVPPEGQDYVYVTQYPIPPEGPTQPLTRITRDAATGVQLSAELWTGPPEGEGEEPPPDQP